MQRFITKVENVTPLTKFCESNCNEIMFINKSPVNIVTVENFPLGPGQFVTIGGNADEIDTTTYRVISVVPGDCWIFRKTYIK